MQSLSKQARITGVMYLAVIICAGFAQGVVRESLIVRGDAVTTAANIVGNIGLFRLGLVSVGDDLIAFILDAVISVMFYQLLKPYGKTLAMVSSSLRLLAHPAIGAINLLHHFMAFHVLSGAEYLTAFEPAQLESLSLFFADAHRYGYLIAGGFFGIHCGLLGIQLIRSGLTPKVFGWMMIAAAMGYVMESFGDFLIPGNEATLGWIVGLSAALGEVGLTLYLLIKGVRKTNQSTHTTQQA